jgi:hypothetical protein
MSMRRLATALACFAMVGIFAVSGAYLGMWIAGATCDPANHPGLDFTCLEHLGRFLALGGLVGLSVGVALSVLLLRLTRTPRQSERPRSLW